MTLELTLVQTAARSAPAIWRRLRKDTPFVRARADWPRPGGILPLDVGVPSGAWQLVAAEPHEYAAQGEDWRPADIAAQLTPKRTHHVDLHFQATAGALVGLDEFHLRLYFWQRTRVPILGVFARCFWVDVQLSRQGNLVDVRQSASGWIRKLTLEATAFEALKIDADTLIEERTQAGTSVWKSAHD